MRSAADYSSQLTALMPRGRAWPSEPGSVLAKLLGGLAEEFARIDGRAVHLLDEADPSTALELLADWERLVGLPDPCRPIADSINERQLAVVTKIAGIGGQTPAYYIALAASAGYEVEIVEFDVFAVGSAAGDECTDDSWRHTFMVEVFATVDALWFSVGSSAGERLRSWGSSNLECLIGRAAPAHASVLFSYAFDPEPALWFDFTTYMGEF